LFVTLLPLVKSAAAPADVRKLSEMLISSPAPYDALLEGLNPW
jgi:hypothetical protein